MREAQHEATSQGQAYEAAHHDQDTGVAGTVRAMLARSPSIADIANLLRLYPGEYWTILQTLHQTLGNSYVQQLIALLLSPSSPAGSAPDAPVGTEASGTPAGTAPASTGATSTGATSAGATSAGATSAGATSAGATPGATSAVPASAGPASAGPASPVSASPGSAGSTPDAPGSTEAQPPAVDAPTRVRVTAYALNVRATPGVETGNMIGALHHHQEVVTTGKDGKWLRFSYQGRVGYIHGGYVEAIPGSPQAGTPEGGGSAETGGSSQSGGTSHTTQDGGGTPGTQQAAPPTTDATKPTDEWVSNAPPPDPAGEQKYSNTTATKAQIFDAITEVAPGLSHELRVMMLGQAWLEQQGKNIINFNFAGMEGKSASYVMARTSTVVSRAEYEKDPSKYSDWGKGNTWNGKDAGTIDVQLARGENQLVVMTRKPRPAYASLSSAAAAFVRNIEAKFHKLQASDDPEHQSLVSKALAGDEHAYAKIVSLRAPKLGILPYNPDSGYPAKVIAQINLARKDLADRAPATL